MKDSTIMLTSHLPSFKGDPGIILVPKGTVPGNDTVLANRFGYGRFINHNLMQIVPLTVLANRKHESWVSDSGEEFYAYRVDKHTAMVNEAILWAHGADYSKNNTINTEQFVRAALAQFNRTVRDSVVAPKERDKGRYFGFQAGWVQDESVADGYVKVTAGLVSAAARRALLSARGEVRQIIFGLSLHPERLTGATLRAKRYPISSGECLPIVKVEVVPGEDRTWFCNSNTAKSLKGDFDGDSPECGTDSCGASFENLITHVKFGYSKLKCASDENQSTHVKTSKGSFGERLPISMFWSEVNTCGKGVEVCLQNFKRVAKVNKRSAFEGYLSKITISQCSVTMERYAILAICVMEGERKLTNQRHMQCKLRRMLKKYRHNNKYSKALMLSWKRYLKNPTPEMQASLVANMVYSSMEEVMENIFDARKLDKKPLYDPIFFIEGLAKTGNIDWEGAEKAGIPTDILKAVSNYVWRLVEEEDESEAVHNVRNIMQEFPAARALFYDRSAWKDGESLSTEFVGLVRDGYDPIYDLVFGRTDWVPNIDPELGAKQAFNAPEPFVPTQAQADVERYMPNIYQANAFIRNVIKFLCEKHEESLPAIPQLVYEKGALWLSQAYFGKKPERAYLGTFNIERNGEGVVIRNNYNRCIPPQLLNREFTPHPKVWNVTQVNFKKYESLNEANEYYVAGFWHMLAEIVIQSWCDTFNSKSDVKMRNTLTITGKRIREFILSHEPVDVVGVRLYRDAIECVYPDRQEIKGRLDFAAKAHAMGYEILMTPKNKPGALFLKKGENGIPDAVNAVHPHPWLLNSVRSHREVLSVLRQAPRFVQPYKSEVPDFDPTTYNPDLLDRMTQVRFVVYNCKANQGGADSIYMTHEGAKSLAARETCKVTLDDDDVDLFIQENPTAIIEYVDMPQGFGFSKRCAIATLESEESKAPTCKVHLGFSTKAYVFEADMDFVVSTHAKLHTLKTPVSKLVEQGKAEYVDLIVPADTVIGKKGATIANGIAERTRTKLTPDMDDKTVIKTLENALKLQDQPIDGKLYGYVVTAEGLHPVGRVFFGYELAMRTAHADSEIWSKGRMGASLSLMQQLLIGDITPVGDGAEDERALRLFNYHAACIADEREGDEEFVEEFLSQQ